MLITDIFSIYSYTPTRQRWESVGPRHQHYLAYQVSGRYDHTFESSLLRVKSGSVVFINRKDSYSVRALEDGYSLCVAFSADTELESTVWNLENSAGVYNLFLKLMQIKNLERKSNLYRATALIYEILSLLCRGTESESSSGIDRIELARDYISDHIAEGEILSSTLAEIVGVSEKHFRNTFKNHYGVTPTQYMIDLRMNMAAAFLSEGRFAVSEVAELVGIFDVYYFSKLFKKRFSVSPSQFAKDALKR